MPSADSVAAAFVLPSANAPTNLSASTAQASYPVASTVLNAVKHGTRHPGKNAASSAAASAAAVGPSCMHTECVVSSMSDSS